MLRAYAMSFLVLLAESLLGMPPKLRPATRRASIAIILRVVGLPDEAYPPTGRVMTWEAFSRTGAGRHSDPSNTEMLFIKRATRAGDAWSGNVAFPGGKQDPEDGGDALATALRETFEEIGVDLSSEHLCLGRLDDRPVYSGGKERSGFVLSPFVFLQTCAQSPALRLEPLEVASARWVPVSTLLHPADLALARGISKPFPLFPAVQALPRTVQAFFGLDMVHFPSIDLPDHPIAGTSVAGAEVGGARVDAAPSSPTPLPSVSVREAVHGADVLVASSPSAGVREGGGAGGSSDGLVGHPTHFFRLWGMTLHATSDLLCLAACHPRASGAVRDHPALAWPPLRLNGAVANAVLYAVLGGVEVGEWARGTRRAADVRGRHVAATLALVAGTVGLAAGLLFTVTARRRQASLLDS